MDRLLLLSLQFLPRQGRRRVILRYKLPDPFHSSLWRLNICAPSIPTGGVVIWCFRGHVGGALADLLVSLYEDTKGRRACRFPCSSPQRKQLQTPGASPSAVTSLPGLWPWPPSLQTVRSQLLLFKPRELLKWSLCSGHVFLPDFLEISTGTAGRRL